jgi:hypothetical protein
MNCHTRFIQMYATQLGYEYIDPRHIEGYILLARPTFNSLPTPEFEYEIEIGIECVMCGGKEEAEKLAQSFGL